MAKIVAVVALKAEKAHGGAPVFIEESKEMLEQTAFLLEKILDASAHDLKNGTIILVDHR
ncbi:capping complex subunit for YIEGIA [Paenibacillus sp. sgz302251]|uniref:capping complex subunit for YIEGIA n=1 Tax=Paenibacillus sp. sgz302251 TaxID=3414493 RepID=UPI003C7E553B